MDLNSILGAIQEKAGGMAPIGNSLKFDFGDDKLLIDGKGDTNKVSLDDSEADCIIHVSKDDLIALFKGELNPMMAMMSGKIKIKGDMGVAMKLQSLLS